MKKYFICSDIHSYYDIWQKNLKSAGFGVGNSEHIIILCGDLLDRGEQPIECLKFVCDLIDKERIICIKGNHEWCFENIRERRNFESFDVSNGTRNTYRILAKDNQKSGYGNWSVIKDGYSHPLVQKYLQHCINYLETDKYIFVHGWIPCIYRGPVDYYAAGPGSYIYGPGWREAQERDWESASWFSGFDAWEDGCIEPNKIIVCGHINTSYAHQQLHNTKSNDIFFDKGIIGLDACTAISNQINILVLTEEELNENSNDDC